MLDDWNERNDFNNEFLNKLEDVILEASFHFATI